ELAPFHRVQRRTYVAYWDLLTTAGYASRLAEIAAEKARQQKLASLSIAFVPAGDVEAEKAFNQRGGDTATLRADGRPGRRGTKWFSYDVPIDPSRPLALVATYNSDNRRLRTFDILVDGTRIAQQTIPQSSVARFVDHEYALPADLLQGKQTITIRFEATGGNEIAAVFGLRVIRA